MMISVVFAELKVEFVNGEFKIFALFMDMTATSFDFATVLCMYPVVFIILNSMSTISDIIMDLMADIIDFKILCTDTCPAIIVIDMKISAFDVANMSFPYSRTAYIMNKLNIILIWTISAVLMKSLNVKCAALIDSIINVFYSSSVMTLIVDSIGH